MDFCALNFGNYFQFYHSTDKKRRVSEKLKYALLCQQKIKIEFQQVYRERFLSSIIYWQIIHKFFSSLIRSQQQKWQIKTKNSPSKSGIKTLQYSSSMSRNSFDSDIEPQAVRSIAYDTGSSSSAYEKVSWWNFVNIFSHFSMQKFGI